ncbi:MAG: ABC transporter ATP-binding protein [Eubacterium sp.]|nr:ABC transporter ATP-binding protein [Eubacterium sp.]
MYLELNDIKKTFGEKDNLTYALRGVTFGVDKGSFVVVLGPSGSGKSTLLNIIGGIENADSGSLRISGDELESFSESKLTDYRRRHLGYVFQSYNLISDLTVRENIEVGAYLSSDPLDIDEMLDVLGMKQHADKFPNQLSGGQQQRTAIGRAVIKNPDLLLCDEPTGALDYHTSKDILQLIDDVNRKYDTTVMMVTHNEALAGMADRVLRLKDGEIVSDEQNLHRASVHSIEW